MTKDERIAELEADLKSQKLLTEIYMAISGTRAEKKDYEKVIRHEICEKIRNELGMTIENSKENTVHCVFYNNMSEILYQIEQGEE